MSYFLNESFFWAGSQEVTGWASSQNQAESTQNAQPK